MAEYEAFVMMCETHTKLLSLYLKIIRDETVFTMILEEVGISVWGEFKRHDVNLRLAFVNRVLYSRPCKNQRAS
jgi:hypothetical protein